MPRRNAAIKRKILPDALYGSERLAKFINVVMRRGKKARAEQIVYGAMDVLLERQKKDKKHDAGAAKKTTKVAARGKTHAGKHDVDQEGLELLEKALHNIRPTVEVKSRRVGGATFQVPIEVDMDRGLALAMRWLVEAAKGRSEKTMLMRLAAEMGDAIENRGTAVKKRDDVHRMAKANQAFAHYRW